MCLFMFVLFGWIFMLSLLVVVSVAVVAIIIHGTYVYSLQGTNLHWILGPKLGKEKRHSKRIFPRATYGKYAPRGVSICQNGPAWCSQNNATRCLGASLNYSAWGGSLIEWTITGLDMGPSGYASKPKKWTPKFRAKLISNLKPSLAATVRS